MSVNMQVSLGGLLMKNPVTTASGTFASGKEYAQFFDVSRLGAITTKGLSLNGWAGNDTPRIAETPSGMLNSIGLKTRAWRRSWKRTFLGCARSIRRSS